MFQILISVLIFLTGLIVGSFLNCVIYRMELQENMPKGSPHRKAVSFLRGKSFCPYCKQTLNWRDLIPVLSFLVLKAKCRYCQKPISFQYPVVELATGFLFVLIFNFWSLEFSWLLSIGIWQLIYLLFISSSLIIIFVYDLKHYIIPDKVVFPAILVSGIWYFVSAIFLNLYTRYEILNVIYAAFGAAGFFLFIVLVSRGRWMGVGDIKLAFLMGLVLGWPNILVALFFSFFIGAIIGTGLIFSGKKKLKSEVPFGPFLVSGTFLAMFWGKQIIDWYLNFFLPF